MNKKEALECISNGEYESVPKEFYKDKSFVLEAVKLDVDGNVLYYADQSFRKDKTIILEAVIQNGIALSYADESLKKDKSFVLKAIKLDEGGIALEYADESLQKDPDIIKAAKNRC
jgi:hypothetical protein